MIKNIIIGKESFVTKALLKFLKNPLVISTNNLDEKIIKKIQQFEKINIIFNNFYPSKLLNDIKPDDYNNFNKLSLEKLLEILANVQPNKINKVIYTSSSAIYRLFENIENSKKDPLNRELYSSFKLAAEKIIQNYCNKKRVNFYIFRLFNTFGNEKDNFSFIEKIIRKRNDNEKITLINNGNSIRDFIHVDDVAKIYKIFLNNNFDNGIYDLGTGKGYIIRDIVNYLNFSKDKVVKKNNIEEMHNSIAEIINLKKILSNFNFIDLGNYLKNKSKIKKHNIVQPISFFKNKNRNILKGIAIYGAGFAGKKIYQELKKSNEEILYFVDDNIKLQNSYIEDIPVISYQSLLEARNYTKIKSVYLAIPSLKKNSQDNLIKKIKNNFFDIRHLPEKKFLLSEKINIHDLNMNEINNILNRKQINIKKLNRLIDKIVLVTGAAGTIGSEICRQLALHNVKKVIAVDKSEIGIYEQQKNSNIKKINYKLLDINDTIFLEKLIKDYNIEIIFHAAAYKHVNILEKNIYSAVKNNIFATYNICKLVKKYSCEMIFISTDKAANPTSILGYTKNVAEKVCEYFNSLKSMKTKIKIVRFGNVFGSSGSAINNFVDKINNEQTIEITSKKATRYFMTVLEACHLVLQTTSIKSKGKIFILNMGKPINIFKLAKNLAKIKTNLNPNYKFKYKEIGLRPGEKLKETLLGKKESIKRINKEMFLVNNKNKNGSRFEKYYDQLNISYLETNQKKIFYFLKKLSGY
jgi:UDP-N-acetylglucosamine 4,6-dehydratase